MIAISPLLGKVVLHSGSLFCRVRYSSQACSPGCSLPICEIVIIKNCGLLACHEIICRPLYVQGLSDTNNAISRYAWRTHPPTWNFILLWHLSSAPSMSNRHAATSFTKINRRAMSKSPIGQTYPVKVKPTGEAHSSCLWSMYPCRATSSPSDKPGADRQAVDFQKASTSRCRRRVSVTRTPHRSHIYDISTGEMWSGSTS